MLGKTERPLLFAAEEGWNDRLWVTAAWRFFFPVAAGRLCGDPIGAVASERLKMVVSGRVASGRRTGIADIARGIGKPMPRTSIRPI